MKTKTPEGETMKARTLYLDEALWQALRLRALEERTTVTGIARGLFRAYLAKPARRVVSK